MNTYYDTKVLLLSTYFLVLLTDSDHLFDFGECVCEVVKVMQKSV